MTLLSDDSNLYDHICLGITELSQIYGRPINISKHDKKFAKVKFHNGCLFLFPIRFLKRDIKQLLKDGAFTPAGEYKL